MLVVIATAGLAGGTITWLYGSEIWADRLWFTATVPILIALAIEIVTSLRNGEVGLDLVAALSMTAALAFGEPLAANVVALMYSGGQLLESFAEGRARREMTALLGRVAHTAMRYSGEALEEVPLSGLRTGDRILVRHGEVVPVDGTLASEAAALDQSSLTGESATVDKASGDEILSGSTNLGNAFDILATRPAAESTYANIVRLVQQAQASKAPSVRIADRYAVWFLLLTLLIAGVAWWLSGDRIRALAVLVVATPCPLILALPVAIISGMSRSAKLGVLIKSGGALEALAKVRTAVLDKTGTLTYGQARVIEMKTTEGCEGQEMLRLAASLDQASSHVIAEALVGEARRRGLPVTAETCTHFLALTDEAYERENAHNYIMSPPLRDADNQARLWQGLREGVLSAVTSDEVSYSAAAKALGLPSFADVANGCTGIEARLPVLFTLGVAEGRLSLERFAEVFSTWPARIFGLGDRKGKIAKGYDADLVV
ncbi:MAG TPA: HAD-IC family P-type ATPase, partial [Mycoplana sp.]|nr:HAD-IC family P-type ATPase [Mycoplana sp.]